MAMIKLKANNFKLYGESALDTWTMIEGANSLSLSRTVNTADTTTFDGAGMTSHLPTTGTYEVAFAGFLVVDDTTGVQSPGQSYIESLVFAFGTSGIGSFRLDILSDDGTTVLRRYSFDASISPDSIGGGNDDAGTWGFTAIGSGALTITELPTP